MNKRWKIIKNSYIETQIYLNNLPTQNRLSKQGGGPLHVTHEPPQTLNCGPTQSHQNKNQVLLPPFQGWWRLLAIMGLLAHFASFNLNTISNIQENENIRYFFISPILFNTNKYICTLFVESILIFEIIHYQTLLSYNLYIVIILKWSHQYDYRQVLWYYLNFHQRLKRAW